MNPIIVNAKQLQLSKGQGLDSQQLSALIDAVALDLANIQTAINNNLVPIINGLPDLTDESIDALANSKVDGSQLYVDNDASTVTDQGLFYDSAAADGDGGFGRPITIREALLTIVQLIAKNAGTNYTEDTEEITISGTDVSNGYVQLTDSLGIIGDNTKFKVFHSVNGTHARRLVSTEYTVDTVSKQVSPSGSYSLVAGDILVIDYNLTEVIL